MEARFQDIVKTITPKSKINAKLFKQSGNFPIISQDSSQISGYWDEENDLIKIETPVIIFGDHTRNVKYIDFDFVAGADGLKILQPNADIDPKYLYYWLLENPVENLGYSRHYRLLKDKTISYPKSIEEQRRIVAKLDAAFEKIDKAQTLLQENIDNTAKLQQSILNEQFKLDADTHTHRLGDILSFEYGKPLGQECRKTEGLYPVYGANGIKNYTDKYYYDRPSIIVGRKGSAGEITKTSSPFWPLDVTYYVTTDDTKMDMGYVFYLLKSLNLPQYAKGVKPGINRNDIYAIKVAVPELSEQKRIAKYIDLNSSRINGLYLQYVEKSRGFEDLKRSLLSQAFSENVVK